MGYGLWFNAIFLWEQVKNKNLGIQNRNYSTITLKATRSPAAASQPTASIPINCSIN